MVTSDDYLAGLSVEQREALEALRGLIRETAPEAEECISYGLPGFRLGRRMLIALGATSTHCALYPMSTAVMAGLSPELQGLDASRGAIRFQPDKPLPRDLVIRIVRARIAENEGR